MDAVGAFPFRKSVEDMASPHQIPVDEILSVEEAAEFLKVPAATVRREARSGRLPGRHVGKEWRFSRSGVVAWLYGQIEGPGEAPARYSRKAADDDET